MGSDQQADALVEQGIELYSDGELDTAMDKWRAALELQRDHPRARQYLDYVTSNRAALEEGFRKAAAEQLAYEDSIQIEDSVDFDVEDHESVNDPVPLESTEAIPTRDEKTSQIRPDLLASWLEESRTLSEGQGEDGQGFAAGDGPGLALIEDDLEEDKVTPASEGMPTTALGAAGEVSSAGLFDPEEDTPAGVSIPRTADNAGQADHQPEPAKDRRPSLDETIDLDEEQERPTLDLMGVVDGDLESAGASSGDMGIDAFGGPDDATFSLDLGDFDDNGEPAAADGDLDDDDLVFDLSVDDLDEDVELLDSSSDVGALVASEHTPEDQGATMESSANLLELDQCEIPTVEGKAKLDDFSDDDSAGFGDLNLDEDPDATPLVNGEGNAAALADSAHQPLVWDGEDDATATPGVPLDESQDFPEFAAEDSGSIPDLPSLPGGPGFVDDETPPSMWFPENVKPLTDAGSRRSPDAWKTLDGLGPAGGQAVDGTDEKPEVSVERTPSGVRRLIAEERLEDALDMCVTILDDTPENDDVVKLEETTKTLLLEQYHQEIGDLSAVPTVSAPRQEIVWQKLDARSGFLLSRVDGLLTFEDIMDVSGMDAFEATKTIVELLRGGIIGLK